MTDYRCDQQNIEEASLQFFLKPFQDQHQKNMSLSGTGKVNDDIHGTSPLLQVKITEK